MTTLDIILVIVGIIILAGCGVAWYFMTFCKMSREEKITFLKNTVCRAIIVAENEIGSKKGQEKLQYVKDWFNTKAPYFCKIVLNLLGDIKIEDIIEMALAEVKNAFEK